MLVDRPSLSVLGSELARTTVDYGARLQRLRDAMAEFDLDFFVSSHAPNVFWMTGFVGSNGTVLVKRSGQDMSLTLITDGRYRDRAEQVVQALKVSINVVIERDSVGAVCALLTGPVSLGLDASNTSWSVALQYQKYLSDDSVKPVPGLVESLRQLKDGHEVAATRLAAAIADEAFATLRPRLADGLSERQVAVELQQQMLALGAEDLAFPSIVASGPNGALPHASPTDRVIDTGDLVVIDIGARVVGYGSDMTRTVAVGDVPERCVEMFEAVAEAQTAGLGAVRDGAEAMAVDQACRSVLQSRGLGEAFIHGTGHSTGLEIHEAPFVSSNSTDRLYSNMLVTVEPGVYLSAVGGVRIEDLLLVTDTGAEVITMSTKEMTLH